MPAAVIRWPASPAMLAPVERDACPSGAAPIAGDRLEQRRLAGAVGARDRHDLTLADVERDIRDRDQALIGLVVSSTRDLKQHGGGPRDRPR